MRNHFASLLEAAMDEDDRVVLLYGDIGNRLFDSIKAKHPARVVNCGVAEANMVSIAAGLASTGLRPVVYTISSFLYLKALEQIKLDIAYPNRSVILVGTGGGLSYASLGTTHHSLEDFAVLGSVPNLRIFSPADQQECSIVFDSSRTGCGPAWIRLGKKGETPVHRTKLDVSFEGDIPPLKISEHLATSGPTDVLILATGLVVAEAEKAGIRLEENGLSTEIWSLPQLKPFPTAMVQEMLGRSKLVVTVEEHVPTGGLYTAVRDSLDGQQKIEIRGLSTGDIFHAGIGSQERARSICSIDSTGIFAEVMRWKAHN